MQSNTSSLRRQRILLAQSSLKNRSAGIYRRLRAFISLVPPTCRIVVSLTRKLSKPYRTWLGRMSVFTSILTLDQMILRLFSIQLDFWYPHVVAVTFFSTTSLWLLVVLEGKMKEFRSTISQLVSK